VLHPAVETLALVLAQTRADAERLRLAGAREVAVSGNLKFDMAPDEALVARGRVWRASLNRPVLLAAVTREGEEQMLLVAWARHMEGVASKPLLVIVPRHPQRFDEVAALLRAAGLRVARRSSWGEVPSDEALSADAWLGDSMREMSLYYGLGEVALLGGSFAPLGGQNLIEAAACACPVVMGLHTFNFAEAADLAQAAGAAIRVKDVDDGIGAALALLGNPAQLAETSAKAVAFATEHRGAAQRMARAISELVMHSP